jgi:hypothetical protein
MTQAERDRLVALKKLITQKQAAEELGITERQVRRLLRELKRRGDKIAAHGLRGLPSNRKISADTEQKAVAILSQPVYRGSGRRWHRNTWRKNTTSRRAGRRCGNG